MRLFQVDPQHPAGKLALVDAHRAISVRLDQRHPVNHLWVGQRLGFQGHGVQILQHGRARLEPHGYRQFFQVGLKRDVVEDVIVHCDTFIIWF